MLAKTEITMSYNVPLYIILFFLVGLAIGITALSSSSTLALQQMAGPIVVKINPGETKTFTWSLLSEKNQTEMVSLSANGAGSEFLSFPKKTNLTSNEVVGVPVTVDVPTNYSGNLTLNPKIRATEAIQDNGSTILNIEMAKVVSIMIDRNTTKNSINTTN